MTTSKMSIKTFVDFGFLQELNRRFLHPLGIALGFNVPDDNEPDTDAPVAFIVDARQDPEGMHFAPNNVDISKIERIDALQAFRRASRLAALGFWIQGDRSGATERSVPTNRVDGHEPHRFIQKGDEPAFEDVCAFCGRSAKFNTHDIDAVMRHYEKVIREQKADEAIAVLRGLKAVLNGYNPIEERAEAYTAGQQATREAFLPADDKPPKQFLEAMLLSAMATRNGTAQLEDAYEADAILKQLGYK